MKRELLIVALGAGLLGVTGTGVAWADGAKTYAVKCQNCHGKDGKGETPTGKQKGAKDLAKSKMSVDEIVKVVTDGKKKDDGKEGSPSFKEKLKPDEIKAVSEYVKATFIK